MSVEDVADRDALALNEEKDLPGETVQILEKGVAGAYASDLHGDVIAIHIITRVGATFIGGRMYANSDRMSRLDVDRSRPDRRTLATAVDRDTMPAMHRKWFVPVVAAVLAAVIFMVVFGLLTFLLLAGEAA